MKADRLERTLLAAIIVVGVARPAHAEEHVSKTEFEAKAAYCKTCHGLSGQGFRGSFPMPRLAGQQPEYLENQLQAFIERRRTNPVMFNVAHVLTPAMVKDLAGYFHDLDPKPLGGAAKGDTAQGRRIYQDGIPDAEVPPCASCHGADARGSGAFPRLAGQLPDYILRKLVNWTKERGQDKARPDNSEIMAPIAHKLTETQVNAVAAYLSELD
jgi:cytochrome c553